MVRWPKNKIKGGQRKRMNTPRPIKKTEVPEVVGKRRRFKLVKVNADGSYTSVLAGQARSFSANALKYEPGRVTESRAFGDADNETKAKMLIYVYEELEQAIDDAAKLGTEAVRKADTRAILEVLPLGFFRENRVKECVTLCEAVLVGKEVWRYAPPKEVDVTSECSVHWRGGCKTYYSALYHGSKLIGEIGPDPFVFAPYRMEKLTSNNFRIFKKN